MALRKDFVDFIACMQSVVDRLDKGIALSPWQTATLRRWFDFHAHASRHHIKQEQGEPFLAVTQRGVPVHIYSHQTAANTGPPGEVKPPLHEATVVLYVAHILHC